MRNMCLSKGLRSIAELTREAVLTHVLSKRSSAGAVNGDLVTLLSSLEQIDDACQELRGRISKVLGTNSEP